MDWKEFFRPTKGKLILPIILILFFLIVIFGNYYFMGKAGSATCEARTKYINPIIRAGIEGDNETAEQLSNELKNFREEKDIPEIYNHILNIGNSFLKKILPLHIDRQQNFIMYYFEEEDIECLQSADKELGELRKIQGYDYEYQERYGIVPWYLFILNPLILILEGYIIFCLVAFIYYKIKSK
jgi:hypothetical protein